MSNLSIFLGLSIGILGFLFLFWHKLKEDYFADQIFSFAFFILVFTLLGFASGLFLRDKIHSSAIFNPQGLWFWLSFAFGSLGFMVASLKYKFKFYEILEASGIAFLFFYFALLLVNSLSVINVKLLLYTLSVGGLIPLFYFLNNNYKKFTWYKSGKIGFSGLVVLGIFFLIHCLVAIFISGMLSFLGTIDALLSILVSFAFFITIFRRS